MAKPIYEQILRQVVQNHTELLVGRSRLVNAFNGAAMLQSLAKETGDEFPGSEAAVNACVAHRTALAPMMQTLQRMIDDMAPAYEVSRAYLEEMQRKQAEQDYADAQERDKAAREERWSWGIAP